MLGPRLAATRFRPPDTLTALAHLASSDFKQALKCSRLLPTPRCSPERSSRLGDPLLVLYFILPGKDYDVLGIHIVEALAPHSLNG